MLLTLLRGGCALMDAAKNDGFSDGDSDTDTDLDTDTDTDTVTDTDTDSGSDTNTDTDTDTGPEPCTEIDRDPRICEDQLDHTAECAERWPDYESASCDPIDQCGCELPQACFPAYDPRGNANGGVGCVNPGAGDVGEPCGAHEECAAGLFCAPALLTEAGQNTCQLPCDDPCDCPLGKICLGYIPPFCRTPDECDPALGEDVCPAGRTCVFMP